MGRPLADPLQATFGPGIGTFGRAPDCTLTLPDEARHLSRQQARIEVAGNIASITCLSAANPLIINGHELRHGQTRQLAHGDRIHVADYELRFENDGAGSYPAMAADLIPDDPFALPDVARGTVAAATGARASMAPARGSDGSRDPFAHRPAADAPPAIPEAYDPFGEPAAPPLHAARGSAASTTDPLGLGLHAEPPAELGGDRTDSIDALFNLEPGLDPMAPGSPLGQPAGEAPRSAQERAADEAAQRQSDPMADNASALSGSFRLPQPIPPTEFGLAEEPVLSWKESDLAREAVLPSAPAGDAAGITAPADQYLHAPMPRVQPHDRPAAASPSAVLPVARSVPAGVPSVAQPAPAPVSADLPFAAHPAEAADADVLLRALLGGLGLAELPRAAGDRHGAGQPLTPELMQRIGALIASACEGTVELLQARATLKQELRADLTMIGSQDNNPLKFAPDGHAALAQLLAAQPVRGFMEPRRAMRNAYDDLLAHQIGYVAGMRAAMQGLIARFDPKVLEQRLASKSVLDAMLPAARKARLWELFNSLYAEVSREAEDDFDRLFGRAFVQAYEEQIARIEAGSARREGGESGRH